MENINNTIIPALNCSRVYLDRRDVSLMLDKKRPLVVSYDGWEILKHCNGINDIDSIFNLVNNEDDSFICLNGTQVNS